MRSPARILTLLTVFSVGYLAGTSNWMADSRLKAQPVSDEVSEKIGEVFAALQAARGALDQDGLYNPASITLSATGILAGGVDAISDLESGRGVDPETFAALYAGQATDEIAVELDKDELGRLTRARSSACIRSRGSSRCTRNAFDIPVRPVTKLRRFEIWQAASTSSLPGRFVRRSNRIGDMPFQGIRQGPGCKLQMNHSPVSRLFRPMG